MAAFNGWAEVVDKLATNCDDVSMVTCQRTGRNPIHYAAMNGHTDVVKILSNFTDTPNAPDKRKYTPIYLAAENGHLDTVEFLVTITDKPLLPCSSGYTPIHSEARMGHLELVKFLVELALKLTEEPIPQAWDYWTPIHFAAYSGHLDIVKFLVDYLTIQILKTSAEKLHVVGQIRMNIQQLSNSWTNIAKEKDM